MTDPLAKALADIETARRQIDDPLAQYEAMTAAQQAAERAVGRLTDLRARAIAELHVDGWSYAKIAEATGLSRARAQQLCARGGDVVP